MLEEKPYEGGYNSFKRPLGFCVDMTEGGLGTGQNM
jgi:hypothetical protein